MYSKKPYKKEKKSAGMFFLGARERTKEGTLTA